MEDQSEIAFILAGLRHANDSASEQSSVSLYPSPPPPFPIPQQHPSFARNFDAKGFKPPGNPRNLTGYMENPYLPPSFTDYRLITPQASPRPVMEDYHRFQIVNNAMNDISNQEKDMIMDSLITDEPVDLDKVPGWFAIHQNAQESLDATGQFNCPICEKVFQRLCNFRSHFRIHISKRPFECSICSNRFLRKHDLNRHEKIHSGVKPYTCQRCGKGFVRKDALRRHLNMDPSVQRFRCVLHGKADSVA